MTSRKKVPVSTFGHVSSPHGRDASAHQLLRKELYPIRSYWHFPKSKMAIAAILDFQFMWIWPFRRVDRAVFVFCTKFGSNICYSHWDRRTFASDLHLMTSHELTSGFDIWSRGHLRAILDFQFMWIWPLRSTHFCFRPSFDDVTRIHFRFWLLVTWSSPRRRIASSHIIWCKISLSSPNLLTFFRNSKWRPPPSWIFSLYEFGHSSVLVVWYLCSVPNLVQISVIVTEIDAHMLQTFIWWRHAN